MFLILIQKTNFFTRKNFLYLPQKLIFQTRKFQTNFFHPTKKGFIHTQEKQFFKEKKTIFSPKKKFLILTLKINFENKEISAQKTPNFSPKVRNQTFFKAGEFA